MPQLQAMKGFVKWERLCEGMGTTIFAEFPSNEKIRELQKKLDERL